MTAVVMEYLNNFYDRIFVELSESTYFSALLQEAERKTGIPGAYIVTAFTTVILLFFILGFGPSVMCDIIVVFYPAYRSFQAVENDDKAASIYWIKYWIVFGIYHAAEHIGDAFFWWLPGYFFIKFFFLVWCFAPVENNGSVIIYENYIRATFLRNAETVDNVLQTVKSFTTTRLTTENEPESAR